MWIYSGIGPLASIAISTSILIWKELSIKKPVDYMQGNDYTRVGAVGCICFSDSGAPVPGYTCQGVLC